MFFSDGSKKGNHIPSVSEMSETARVNQSLFLQSVQRDHDH